MRSYIDQYANATFIVLSRQRNEHGRWDYSSTAPTPDIRVTGRCRIAQGNRLVEGVNGNVRSLNILCDGSKVVDVDDFLQITFDVGTPHSPSGIYSVIGIEAAATVNKRLQTKKIVCIEAGAV
jgi:hypothetical protein